MEQQPKLGVLTPDDARRDAIHVAIAPVTAGERLSPGEHVGFVAGQTEIVTSEAGTLIGIVDPFLKAPVRKGQRCYLCLYPQTVTSLRHEWTHPAFGEDKVANQNHGSDIAVAEKWLHDFAAQWNFDYAEMVSSAQEKEGYVVADGIDLHSSNELSPGDESRFWECIETVTGKRFSAAHRENFGWSCSC